MVSIFALFAVAAAVTSYLVGNGVWIPLWHLPFGYVGTFIEIFFSQYVVYCLYSLLVKPRLSPLRHLPGPKVRGTARRRPLRSGREANMYSIRVVICSWDSGTKLLVPQVVLYRANGKSHQAKL